MEVFLDESGTEITWDAAIQDRCLAETRDEHPQLCGGCGAVAIAVVHGFFYCQHRIDFRMFHITFDDPRRRIPGVDVHGDNRATVINDTQMTMMVLVQTTFMDLADVQDVHHADVCRCKDHMPRPVVLGKQPLDLVAKDLKIMFKPIVF